MTWAVLLIQELPLHFSADCSVATILFALAKAKAKG